MANSAGTALPHYSVGEIARRYAELGIPGRYSPEVSRLLIAMLREVAKGSPVTADQIGQIGPETVLSPDEQAFLSPERNADGNVVGLMGLTQNQAFAISFTVDGVELRTWCALDSLFLPLLLNRPASVSALSALHGEPVRFTVGPDGVEAQEPAAAVVSLVIPSVTARHGIRRVEDIWNKFCHQIRFFVSPDEAEEWAWDKQDLELAQLSVPETFELAKQAWGDLSDYARA